MGPCILTAPALTPPLPPDHASVPRQGTGLPQRKLTPPASCGGPPYTPHTPQGSWGGGAARVMHVGSSTALAGTFRGICQPMHHLSIQVRSCCQMSSEKKISFQSL